MMNNPGPAADTERLAALISDRYRIEREAGRGGMATVYLAHDLRHDRQVALKVLRPELAAALGTERFLQEIRITARLSHPHILPLLDSGTAGGFLYYAMPWVQGESLRQRLEREAQLPLDSALSLARQVAAALGCAHEQGIVHRDIKPENILLHGGEAVVADFGIALALRLAGAERLTATGLSLGTPQYMSPEQASGDAELDVRSDVYSLGAVLYEMLVGEPPFTGATTGIVLAKLLTAEPIAPRVLRRSIPEHVNRAVVKALAKAPADRFATVAEFARALAEPFREPARVRRSVAVLPFANLTPDPQDEYFSDGLTEDLIARLGRTPSLKVISRTSVMAFKHTSKSIPEIGEALGVETVLEGSVRRSAVRVRITAQLVDARSDEHIWAETYDRQLADLLDLQAEVADAIATALQARILPGESCSRREQRPLDIETYNLCLLGRHHWHRWTEPDLLRSIELYEQALARDPDNAVAHSGLGLTLGTLGLGYWSVRGVELHARIMQEYDRALELDPELSEARVWRAVYRWQCHSDWAGATADIGHVLECDPGSALGHDAHGWLLTAHGRHAEAAREAGRAVELDPLSQFTVINAALRAYRGRDYHASLALFERAIAIDPNLPMGHFLSALPLVALGRADAALEGVRRAQPGFGQLIEPILAYTLAAAGETVEARSVLQACETRRVRAEHVWPFGMAMAHARLRDEDRALDWLDQAYAERDFWLTWLAVEPALDPLRAHSRFRELQRRVGLDHVPFTPRPSEHRTAPSAVHESSVKVASLGPSIVVLPFENLSPDPDNAFFADGLTEELIADLSAVRSLRVISRTSARACCGGGRSAPEIARELNVRYVLYGSVRRAATSLRITARLVDAVEDRQLWAEKYGGTLEDVFAIQEQVSAAIVTALRLTITPEESRALARRPISDPRAHDCYLRARYEIWQFSREGLDRARRHIANAEAIVGENALLATTLGHIHIMYLEAGIDPDPTHLAEAAACAERAFRLEPESARAHWISGHVHFTRGELSQAMAAFERARRAAPDEPDMLLMLGYTYALVGRNRDAAVCFERALVVDPLLPLNHCMSGFLAVLEGRFQDALAPYRRFYEMDADSPFAHWCVAWALAWNRKLDEAEAFAVSMAERFPGEVITVLAQSLLLGLRGRQAEALAAITPACEAAAGQTEMLTRELCHCYAVAGHTAKALEWLERTVVRMRNYEFLARHDVFLENIRQEPAFQDILRGMAHDDAIS